MEVGAVKQAFNNEVIQLKNSLNQAKIHTIHKLTRKAKTFNEKKAPDKLKEKLKRKAESAVNEVLIIKKIKPRDIARFIVTHKGNINDYLNKPEVDENKACARLLLHKALQIKYKTIRDRFGNISINDLLMSRHERRKIKKEMREKQKDKKKGKSKIENTKTLSDKDVEIVDKEIISDDEENESILNGNREKYIASDDQNDEKDCSDDMSDDYENSSGDENVADDTRKSSHESNSDNEEEEDDNNVESDHSIDNDDINNVENEAGKFVRVTPIKDSNNVKSKVKIDKQLPVVKIKNKKTDKRKENKNKNINEKILKRNFNKKADDAPQALQVVDPFFKTATGANYMSLAEPRAPDKVKEVHKQGNRKYRRAVMFGHVPKSKPRKFDQDNNHYKNAYNNKNADTYNKNSATFNKNNNFKSFNNNNESKNKFIDNKPHNKINEKPEKLHPSWEAKKKLSSVLPFQGKKIVFDDS